MFDRRSGDTKSHIRIYLQKRWRKKKKQEKKSDKKANQHVDHRIRGSKTKQNCVRAYRTIFIYFFRLNFDSI